MLRWLRFHLLVPLIFFIGVVQYGVIALPSALRGDVVSWTLDAATQADAGVFRYFKDGFLLLLSLIWPIYVSLIRLPPGAKSLIFMYVLWMGAVISFGLVGYVIYSTPDIFLAAGFRWLMLIHAGFGVFLLMSSVVNSYAKHGTVFFCLLFLAVLDLLVIALQARALGISNLGAVRLTGLFNNAGIAGFFGLALALCGWGLTGVSLGWRALLSGAAMAIALSSGTRSMMIGIFIILFFQILSASRLAQSTRSAMLLRLLMIPLAVGVAWIGYAAMINVVDRGGIFEEAMLQGGRIGNFLGMMDTLYAADYAELLFGRGLGVGTNTAYSMLIAEGGSPEVYRFNWLIDNAFLTEFFQFGIFGSVVFWGGMAAFLYKLGKGLDGSFRVRHRVSCALMFFILWAGNPFEHYFLVMPFAIALGCAYWEGRSHAPRAAQ